MNILKTHSKKKKKNQNALTKILLRLQLLKFALLRYLRISQYDKKFIRQKRFF